VQRGRAIAACCTPAGRLRHTSWPLAGTAPREPDGLDFQRSLPTQVRGPQPFLFISHTLACRAYVPGSSTGYVRQARQAAQLGRARRCGHAASHSSSRVSFRATDEGARGGGRRLGPFSCVLLPSRLSSPPPPDLFPAARHPSHHSSSPNACLTSIQSSSELVCRLTPSGPRVTLRASPHSSSHTARLTSIQSSSKLVAVVGVAPSSCPGSGSSMWLVDMARWKELA